MDGWAYGAAARPNYGPAATDSSLADAVDAAVVGDPADGIPEADPDRHLGSNRDFASVYIRTRSSLAARARSFLSDERDVDEVVQETFLRLFLAMPELETERQALAFCRRVLTNLCIDRYRADRRRPQLFRLDESLSGELADDDYTDHPILRAEDAAVVRRALGLLSPLHRAALVKREVEEKPLPVIAAELDVPEESVKHLLFRARRSLRRLLVGSAVDPAAELSAGETLAAAHRRLAHATLGGAKALVMFLAMAVAVAGGLGLSGLRSGGDTDGSTVPNVGHRASQPSAVPVKPAVPSDSSPVRHGYATTDGGHGGHHGAVSQSGTTSGETVRDSGSHQPAGTSQPVGQPSHPAGGSTGTPGSTGSRQHPGQTQGGGHHGHGTPGSGPGTGPGGGGTPPPGGGGNPPPGGGGNPAPLALTGDLSTTGTPSVADAKVLDTGSQEQTLFSVFQAPTNAGAFQMTQAVTVPDETATGGGTATTSGSSSSDVTFTPNVPVDGQSLPTAVTFSDSQASTMANGDTAVTGQLSVIVAPGLDGVSTVAPGAPATQLSIQMEVTPSGEVAQESVDVQNVPDSSSGSSGEGSQPSSATSAGSQPDSTAAAGSAPATAPDEQAGSTTDGSSGASAPVSSSVSSGAAGTSVTNFPWRRTRTDSGGGGNELAEG